MSDRWVSVIDLPVADVKQGTSLSCTPLGSLCLEFFLQSDAARDWYSNAYFSSMSRWMAAAGGFSLSKGGFLPVSNAIVRYWIPTSTWSGRRRDFFRAGMNVSEFMLLQEYIIQPMHSERAAWQERGCLLMVNLCLELDSPSWSSMPNLAIGTGCFLKVIRRRLRYTLLPSCFGLIYPPR